jgi:hypothetical protein
VCSPSCVPNFDGKLFTLASAPFCILPGFLDNTKSELLFCKLIQRNRDAGSALDWQASRLVHNQQLGVSVQNPTPKVLPYSFQLHVSMRLCRSHTTCFYNSCHFFLSFMTSHAGNLSLPVTRGNNVYWFHVY